MPHPNHERPIELTPLYLVGERGRTQRWWKEYLPAMRADGAVSKIGRYYFGTLAAVDDWLRVGPRKHKVRKRAPRAKAAPQGGVA